MRSIVSYPDRGKYGSNKYRGNATGKLLIDLHNVYKFNEISDYMAGSFTAKDVGIDLNIKTNTYDLNQGFDLIKEEIKERNQFVFWHPPYWDIIKYSGFQYGDKPIENDLSHIKEYREFIRAINYCLGKQFASLKIGGRMAILMADVKKNKKLYSMLLDMDKLGTIEQIVVKEQINCMSDNKIYANNNFISIAHEYLLILRKDNSYTYEYSIVKSGAVDIRNSLKITWKDLIASVLEVIGKNAKLADIYKEIEGHRKCQSNKYWREKVRQTLQLNEKIFKRVDKGVWALA